jgi:hypothetical protein
MAAPVVPSRCTTSTSFFEKTRLLITGNIQGGLGDVAAICKITEIFLKYLPKEQIALCYENEHSSLFENFRSTIHSVQKILIHPSFLKECEEQDLTQFRSFAPTHIVSFHLQEPFRPDLIIDPIPSVNFDEYASDPTYPLEFYESHKLVKCSLGLMDPLKPFSSFHRLGIFQSSMLSDYAADSKNEQSAYRLPRYICRVDKKIQELIFSFDTEKELSYDLFVRDHLLYFGYVNPLGCKALIEGFIAGMIEKSRRKDPHLKNLVFVFPGIPFLKTSTSHEAEFRTFLLKNRITQFEMAQISKDGSVKVIRERLADEEDGALLRIVSCFLSHEDFLSLMLAAEPEVLTTGDQSTTEALVAGKRLFYQALLHKEGFKRSLEQSIFHACRLQVSFCKSLYERRGMAFEDRAQFFRQHFEKMDHPSWKKMCYEISQKQNCEAKIIEMLIKTSNGVF